MNFYKKLSYLVLSILLIGGLSACEDSGPAETAGKKIDQTIEQAGDNINETADKVGVVIDDTEITSKVKAAIFAKSGLDTLKISVNTIKGVVTLSGVVASAAHSEMAIAIAKKVSGVKQVINLLAVKTILY
jgi:hyperosmotically inducible protein